MQYARLAARAATHGGGNHHTSSSLYRFKPSTEPVFEEIIREDNGFSIPGPIVGKDIYFANGYVLKSMRMYQ